MVYLTSSQGTGYVVLSLGHMVSAVQGTRFREYGYMVSEVLVYRSRSTYDMVSTRLQPLIKVIWWIRPCY